jgi:hypothetical protein
LTEVKPQDNDFLIHIIVVIAEYFFAFRAYSSVFLFLLLGSWATLYLTHLLQQVKSCIFFKDILLMFLAV